MSRVGRKRKMGKREKNGRISRQKHERQARRPLEQVDVMHVARVARERVLGVHASSSGTDLGGTAIGRMLLRELVTRRHYDAAEIVANRRAAYVSAIGLGHSSPQAVDINAVHGRSGFEMSSEATRYHIERWDELVKVLDAAGRRGHLYAVVWSIVISDRDNVRDAELLRVALSAVADSVGLPMDKLAEAA